jgi:hypothetical protein
MTKIFILPLTCVTPLPAFCIAFKYRGICSRSEYSRNTGRLSLSNIQSINVEQLFPRGKKNFWILNKYIIILPEIAFILYLSQVYILFQIHMQTIEAASKFYC